MQDADKSDAFRTLPGFLPDPASVIAGSLRTPSSRRRHPTGRRPRRSGCGAPRLPPPKESPRKRLRQRPPQVRNWRSMRAGDPRRPCTGGLCGDGDFIPPTWHGAVVHGRSFRGAKGDDASISLCCSLLVEHLKAISMRTPAPVSAARLTRLLATQCSTSGRLCHFRRNRSGCAACPQ